MRLAELTIGFLVFLFSILGYQYSANVVETVQNMLADFVTAFFTNINLQNQQSYLTQMGYPSAESIKKVVQVGFIATTIIGAGFACFGAIAKKPIPKQFQNITFETKFAPNTPEPVKGDKLKSTRSISILKERLAKGEITEREFEKLRRFIE